MTQPDVREYKTAEEALVAANRYVEALIKELNLRTHASSYKPSLVQFAVRKPEPHPERSEFLRGLGIRVGDTVKLKNGDTGKVMATDVLDAARNEVFIYVGLKNWCIAYDFDGWPQNDSLCRYLEDAGLPLDSNVSDFKIVSITRDKGRLSQITITNTTETPMPDRDSEELRLAYEQAFANNRAEFDLHRFNHPPIVAGMEFD